MFSFLGCIFRDFLLWVYDSLFNCLKQKYYVFSVYSTLTSLPQIFFEIDIQKRGSSHHYRWKVVIQSYNSRIVTNFIFLNMSFFFSLLFIGSFYAKLCFSLSCYLSAVKFPLTISWLLLKPFHSIIHLLRATFFMFLIEDHTKSAEIVMLINTKAIFTCPDNILQITMFSENHFGPLAFGFFVMFI